MEWIERQQTSSSSTFSQDDSGSSSQNDYLRWVFFQKWAWTHAVYVEPLKATFSHAAVWHSVSSHDKDPRNVMPTAFGASAEECFWINGTLQLNCVIIVEYITLAFRGTLQIAIMIPLANIELKSLWTYANTLNFLFKKGTFTASTFCMNNRHRSWLPTRFVCT